MERKRNNTPFCWSHMAMALCVPLLMASCATKQVASKDAPSKQADQNGSASLASGAQSETVKKLTFVQRVSDNQVYAKNITGSMSFSIQMGGKDVTVPGALKMRKDEVIRMQLFIPILGTEIGRLEFTPDYVLIIDRLHKEYIKADYNKVDFLQKQGITFYSLQALFWNQLLLPGAQRVRESDLKKFDANLSASGETVPVTLTNGNMHYTWKANRNTGRIEQADILYKDSHGTSTLNLKYGNFKNVGVKFFPASQVLTLVTDATQKKQEAKVTIEMGDVKTDANWDAHTEVSAKYKQISPDDVLGKLLSM